jgi:N-acetylmuramoyl-L-alanine amidase
VRSIIERPSPNHDARPPEARIQHLVLHYTDMTSVEAALERLCDPRAEVSAHYLIDQVGQVYRLVADERRAWHAGRSVWRGVHRLNASSIGIELANPGHTHGYRAFPEAQMSALEALARMLLARHPIPARNVVGHSDIAPERKRDPGELFDWPRLARAGIGLWPNPTPRADGSAPLAEGSRGAAVERLARALAAYGYGLATGQHFTGEMRAVVQAFQRHFRPALIDGMWDGTCTATLGALLALAGEPEPT